MLLWVPEPQRVKGQNNRAKELRRRKKRGKWRDSWLKMFLSYKSMSHVAFRLYLIYIHSSHIYFICSALLVFLKNQGHYC